MYLFLELLLSVGVIFAPSTLLADEAACEAHSLSFSLRPNGDGTGARRALTSSHFSSVDDILTSQCCPMMDLPPERCAANSGARLVTEVGTRVMSLDDIESIVYCVPNSVHFVWPNVKAGRKVFPQNVVSPIKNRPIRLTQLSEDVQVFSVTNFVTPEEIKELIAVSKDRVKKSKVCVYCVFGSSKPNNLSMYAGGV
jgi:hypothetical protein